MIETIRCDYCMILFEGVMTDTCPNCHSHIVMISARYPSLKKLHEETNEEAKND